MTAPKRPLTAQQRRRKQEYDRWYHSSHGKPSQGVRIIVPDDIVRVETSEPCFACGSRAPCRHARPQAAVMTLAGVCW